MDLLGPDSYFAGMSNETPGGGSVPGRGDNMVVSAAAAKILPLLALVPSTPLPRTVPSTTLPSPAEYLGATAMCMGPPGVCTSGPTANNSGAPFAMP